MAPGKRGSYQAGYPARDHKMATPMGHDRKFLSIYRVLFNWTQSFACRTLFTKGSPRKRAPDNKARVGGHSISCRCPYGRQLYRSDAPRWRRFAVRHDGRVFPRREEGKFTGYCLRSLTWTCSVVWFSTIEASKSLALIIRRFDRCGSETHSNNLADLEGGMA